MPEELFEKMRELNLPPGKYALFGSVPICIRGWKDCDHDADIIVTEDVWEEYKGKPEWGLTREDHGGQGEFLRNGPIELWKNWDPGDWNVEELIKNAEMVDGLPCVRIERVIEYKRLRGLEKDLKDIEIIQEHIKK